MYGYTQISVSTNSTTRLVNNLFRRTSFQAMGAAGAHLAFSNNLFWGGTNVTLRAGIHGSLLAYDNVFDSCHVNSAAIIGGVIHNDFNAYLNCAGGTVPLTNAGPNNIILTNTLSYQTGPLGSFYQPPNSPLRDAGSVSNAALAGFHYYTTTTNQVWEASSVLDIGYHYISVDAATGLPIDSDWDGIPDYLDLDSDGDGLPDAWELQHFGGLNSTANGDFDGDGLTNAEEFAHGFDPANPDEDENGIADGSDDWDGDLLANKAELARYHTSPFGAYSVNALRDDIVKLGGAAKDDIRSEVSFQTVSYSGSYYTIRINGTEPGKKYLILSTEQLYGNWYWQFEKVVTGAEGQTYTIVDIETLGRWSLFETVGYGEDTDGDGLPDFYETKVTGTMPDVADSDGDGISDGAADPDFDGKSNLQEYVGRTDPNEADADNDGLFDWWEIEHFGNLSQTGDDDYDGDGVLNINEYYGGTNPNTLSFQPSLNKVRTNMRDITGMLNLLKGRPAQMAILFDDDDVARVSWAEYPQNENFSLQLPAEEGNRKVRVGLVGLNPAGKAEWRSVYVIYDATPAALTVEVPEADGDGVVSRSLVLVTGASAEGLKQVVYEVNTGSASGGEVVSMEYDAVKQDFGATTFRCRNVALQPGENTITVRALDFAGNQTTVSKVLNYVPTSIVPPPPLAVHVSFPPDNAKISGGSFVIAGSCEGLAVSVVVTADGSAPIEAAVETKTGCFVVNDIPVRTEPTTYTVTAVGESGEVVASTVHVQPRQINWGHSQTASPEEVIPPTYDFTAWAWESLASVVVNGRHAVWDSLLEEWRIESLQPRLTCGPLFTRVITLPDGTVVYEADNAPLGARFSWMTFTNFARNRRWDNGSLMWDYSSDLTWNMLSGGVAIRNGYYSWGINAGGPTYFGVLHDEATFDRRKGKTSCFVSGPDPEIWPTVEDNVCRRIRRMPMPLWDQANDDPAYDTEWYGTERYYEGVYHGGSIRQFFAGGLHGGPAGDVFWFTMTASKQGYDGEMETPPSEKIPAANFSLFGEQMLVASQDPNNPEDDSYLFTGHLLKRFDRFDALDATPLVAKHSWYSADPTATKLTLNILGDANLDGQITQTDEPWKDRNSCGILVRCNNDDDDLDAILDHQDEVINGWSDAVQLTQVRLEPITVPEQYSLRLRLADPFNSPSGTTADEIVRIFDGNVPGTSVAILGPDSPTYSLPTGACEAGMTLYAEGIIPGAGVRLFFEIEGPAGTVASDAVRLNVLAADVSISRKNGDLVPENLEHSNGSLVQLVPSANPSKLYPDGIFLSLPKVAVEPMAVVQKFIEQEKMKLRLKVDSVGSSSGKIRVYRKGPGESAFEMMLGAPGPTETERFLELEELAGTWKLDSTLGGVVDLSLVIETGLGAELHRDTVRVSSIPVEPADGRIVFVNPGSASPGAPFDDFLKNAAHSVQDALAELQDDDNTIIAPGSYEGRGMNVYRRGVVAGLAGTWNDEDPDQEAGPLADSFGYSGLPTITASGPTATFGVFSIFTSSGVSAGALVFGGLHLANGDADGAVFDNLSGGAMHFAAIQSTLHIAYCDFDANQAPDFGGAVYLNEVADARIETSKFRDNKAWHKTGGSAVWDKGMGGAIASINSTLVVSGCVFAANLAQVTGPGGEAPPLGSAGGGGDVYVLNGSFKLIQSRSQNAVAGRNVVPTENPEQGARYFTGDGGSILLHGQEVGTTLEIRGSVFEDSISYGNGGAISISYDSSAVGRQFFLPPTLLPPNFETEPVQLGGICDGVVSGTKFDRCVGGWQGGAISANGRGVHLTVNAGTAFDGCIAGATHLRDGKGGAVAICGGLQANSGPPTGHLVLLDNCIVKNCSASGNGGGLYVTIRGLLEVKNTTVRECAAQNSANSPRVEGMGGGIHASAGGHVQFSGESELLSNGAAVSGGGLSVKSAAAFLDGSVTIRGNMANGSAVGGWGNGGGVFVTTSLFDDDPPGGAGWGAATLYASHGTLVTASTATTLLVEYNTANRWGGGAYVGISHPWYGSDNDDQAQLVVKDATVRNNICFTPAIVSQFMPAQIAVERVGFDELIAAAAEVDISGTTISGNSTTDIGLYLWDSIAPVASGAAFNSLAVQVLQEAP